MTEGYMSCLSQLDIISIIIYMKRMIKNVTTDQEYASVAEAANALGVRQYEIKQHLSGEIRRVRGCLLRLIERKRKKRIVRDDLKVGVHCITNGKIYSSITQAAKIVGVQRHVMIDHLNGRRPKDIQGQKYERMQPVSKVVRNLDTGELYRSTHDAAHALGVSPGAVVHCLKGRQKTVAGVKLAYETRQAFLHGKPSPRRLIRDEQGNIYKGYTALAKAKGLTPARARVLVLREPDGVFRQRVTTRRTNDLFAPIEQET